MSDHFHAWINLLLVPPRQTDTPTNNNFTYNYTIGQLFNLHYTRLLFHLYFLIFSRFLFNSTFSFFWETFTFTIFIFFYRIEIWSNLNFWTHPYKGEKINFIWGQNDINNSCWKGYNLFFHFLLSFYRVIAENPHF